MLALWRVSVLDHSLEGGDIPQPAIRRLAPDEFPLRWWVRR